MAMEKLNNDEFIKRINNIFGKNYFDYSLLDYKGAHINVKLICKKCNNIEEKPPTVLYKGIGCLKCNKSKVGRKSLTTEEFISRSNKIHKYKYDYSKTIFINRNIKLIIICNKHGEFLQLPQDHYLSGCGCPKCKTSKGEEEIAIWLNKNKIKYIYQYNIKIKNSNHYYDFYLPQYKILIEFQGKQHYEPIEFFGGLEGFNYLKERDLIKEQYCIDNNMILIKISYNDNINFILNKQINEFR